MKSQEYKRRLSLGLCTKCGQASELDRTKCRECLDKSKAAQAKHVKKIFDLAVCIKCGLESIEGKRKCFKCMLKEREYVKIRNQERKNQGICRYCDNKATEYNNTFCNHHVNKHKESVRQKKSKRRDATQCESCGSDVVVTFDSKKLLCKKCFLKVVSMSNLGTSRQWREIEALFNEKNICPYTGLNLVLGKNASLDHRVPRSRGGSDEISNLQWVHNSENLNVNWMKGDLTHDEFKSAVCLISEYLQKDANVV